jgi:hypothetical protein
MNLPSRTTAICRLALAAAIILLNWLVVLPAISKQPTIASYLKRMDDKGIDASAMFYTELEMNQK